MVYTATNKRQTSSILLRVLPFVHWAKSLDIRLHAVSWSSFVYAVIDLCTLTAYLISLLGQACMEGGQGWGRGVGRCTVAPAD